VSFHAVVAALDIAKLDPGAKFLLVVLGSYANTDNTLWPSQDRLASDTCMSPRTIRTHLTTLEERLLIKREHRRVGNRQTSDLITLLFVPAKSATTSGFEAAKSASSGGKKRHSEVANIATKPVIEPIIEPVTRAREAVRSPHESGEQPTAPAANEDRAQIAAAMKSLTVELAAARRPPQPRRIAR
jgi:DNA-binding transcriptional ArsR family regulator